MPDITCQLHWERLCHDGVQQLPPELCDNFDLLSLNSGGSFILPGGRLND